MLLVAFAQVMGVIVSNEDNVEDKSPLLKFIRDDSLAMGAKAARAAAAGRQR